MEITSIKQVKEILWWWQGTVILGPQNKGVIDGDSVWISIDRGWNDSSKRNVRLARINAPELRSPTLNEGNLAKDRLTELIPVGTEIYLRTFKWEGKYGRFVADIYIPQDDETLVCVNDIMVVEGLAQYKDY